MKQSSIRLDKAPRTPELPATETDWDVFDALTDKEVTDAAKADPDCPPLSDEALKRLRRRPKRH